MYSLKLYLLLYTSFDLPVAHSFSFLTFTGFSFLATLVYFFSPLPNGEYSNLFKKAAFSSDSFSGKTSLSFKNSYHPTFLYDKAEVLAVCHLNCIELGFARLYY